MEHYKKKDMETWERKGHYRYYTEKLKVEFNVTVSLDVKNVLDVCHRKQLKFYPVMIYLVTKVLNQIENFRMFLNGQGELCVWNQLNPNYTVFHDDDKTFSDCWTSYSDDFTVFYQNIIKDMKMAEGKRGIKAKENQPADFYCISCVPWIPFTSCSSRVANGTPSYFPIITMGKYEREEGKVKMPINLTIAHAVCDGYHAGLFFEKLQDEMNYLNDCPVLLR